MDRDRTGPENPVGSGPVFRSGPILCIPNATSASVRNELQSYLDEQRLDRKLELDVLSWWKKEEFRYPILSRLAGDMLMIPDSTVASESAFSTAGRILDQYRRSLLPETVQALLCSRDWLFSKKVQDSSVVDSLVEDVLDLTAERGNECG
ncbi:unnamed protein product [Rhodiola kirilowii]